MSIPARIRIVGVVFPVALILGACGSSGTTNTSTNTSAHSSTHAKHGAQKHPGAVGVIAAVNATSLTLRELSGATRTVTLGASTKIRAGKGASGTTLVIGERVRVSLATGSTTAAKSVVVLAPTPAASPSG